MVVTPRTAKPLDTTLVSTKNLVSWTLAMNSCYLNYSNKIK